jgi:hypothetical protein
MAEDGKQLRTTRMAPCTICPAMATGADAIWPFHRRFAERHGGRDGTHLRPDLQRRGIGSPLPANPIGGAQLTLRGRRTLGMVAPGAVPWQPA